MNFLLPMTSLIGPIYFGIEGWPIGVVLTWAAIWTALRFIATWKQVYAALQEGDNEEPPSWIDRHPSIQLLAAMLATLIVFAVVHVAIYGIMRELLHNWN